MSISPSMFKSSEHVIDPVTSTPDPTSKLPVIVVKGVVIVADVSAFITNKSSLSIVIPVVFPVMYVLVSSQ